MGWEACGEDEGASLFGKGERAEAWFAEHEVVVLRLGAELALCERLAGSGVRRKRIGLAEVTLELSPSAESTHTLVSINMLRQHLRPYQLRALPRLSPLQRRLESTLPLDPTPQPEAHPATEVEAEVGDGGRRSRFLWFSTSSPVISRWDWLDFRGKLVNDTVSSPLMLPTRHALICDFAGLQRGDPGARAQRPRLRRARRRHLPSPEGRWLFCQVQLRCSRRSGRRLCREGRVQGARADRGGGTRCPQPRLVSDVVAGDQVVWCRRSVCCQRRALGRRYGLVTPLRELARACANCRSLLADSPLAVSEPHFARGVRGA